MRAAAVIVLLAAGVAHADCAIGGSNACFSALGNGLMTTASGSFAVYGGAACPATQYVSAVSSSGALTCSTPAGGSGAPADAKYITQTANDGLSAEQAMGALGTGLVINTTTTGVQSIYGGSTCTNQFARSLNASGAATCASVSLTADVTGVLPPANGGERWTYLAVSGSNVTDNAIAVATPITGLAFSAVAATNYRLHCSLVTSAAAATTGVQVGITGPASPTEVTWSRMSCASATASAFASINSFAADARTASAGTTRCVESLDFVLRNGANTANVQLTVTTEIDASVVTVFIGSWCEYMAF